jgi:UDP-3-O-[3-hydroxymyristoyl] glucosamine N-acyltransferase
MSDPAFFSAAGALSAAEICEITGAKMRAGDDSERTVGGIAPLDLAGPRDLAFIASPKYADQLPALRAGICLASERFAPEVSGRTVVLIARDPYRAFVAVGQKLFPEALRPSTLTGADGVVPGAFVHPTARLEPEVRIDPGVVIGPRAEIGAQTVIAAGAVVGPDVRIGRRCAIGACASITHALIGDDVTIHAGCRIGQDGFGYVSTASGHNKVPQIGRVIIQDRVEIGANTTVDRGGTRDTIVGEGTKIDNLVQIGHNALIGRHCLIVAQSGLSGSVTMEDYAVLGGQVGIADHLTIGEGAQVGAKSGVMTDVPAGGRWLGSPAMPRKTFFRYWAGRETDSGRTKSKTQRTGEE